MATHTNPYYDDLTEKHITPEQRMPKLYSRKPDNRTGFGEQTTGWVYPVENKSLDYISSLSSEDRENLFFIKAVKSEKQEGFYIKVLKINQLILSEIVDLLHDDKAILFNVKEDD